MVIMSTNVVILLKLKLCIDRICEWRFRGKEIVRLRWLCFCQITEEQEEIKASLGVPQIFLGNIGRLNEDRFSKYYCKRCEKEYHGSPVLSYKSPNEELGEGVILIEKGEYRCRICNNLIALYRKFNK